MAYNSTPKLPRKAPKLQDSLVTKIQENRELKDTIKDNMEKDTVIKDLTLIIHYLEIKLGIYKGLEDADESV